MGALTRKRFLQLGIGVLGGGLAGSLGCGDDEDASFSAGGGGGDPTGGNGNGGSSNGNGGSSNGNGGSSNGNGGSGNGGNGNGGSGGGSAVCMAAITALISNNHSNPHELTIPLEDVLAGEERDYDTTGPSTHCHTITVTAADFAALQAGEVVVKHSCSGQTDHEYVLSCAANPPPGGTPDCNGTPTLGTCN